MNEQNYSIEEMEDAAVKKSNIAKTVGVAAAMGVVGAGVAVGANAIVNNDNSDIQAPEVPEPAVGEDLSEQDLAGAADNGVQSTTFVEEHTTIVHEPAPAPAPAAETEQEPEVQFEERVEVRDSEGNLQSSVETFTIDGQQGALIDNDGDNVANAMWIDDNNNGQIDEDEVREVSEYNINMGNEVAHTQTYITSDWDEEHIDDEDHQYVHNDDVHTDDINNDFDGAKQDQEYHGDLADNNPDYNNHGNVSNYTASVNDQEQYAQVDAEDDAHGHDSGDYGHDDYAHEDFHTEEFAQEDFDHENPEGDPAEDNHYYEGLGDDPDGSMANLDEPIDHDYLSEGTDDISNDIDTYDA